MQMLLPNSCPRDTLHHPTLLTQGSEATGSLCQGLCSESVLTSVQNQVQEELGGGMDSVGYWMQCILS